MVVDSDGRAYVGSLGFDLRGGAPASNTNLVVVSPHGTVSIAAEGLGFPNGGVITPDGKTFVLAESFANRLTAFDINGGALINRRTWAQFGPVPTTTDALQLLAEIDVSADGICMDSEGAIWLTNPPRKRVLRAP
ncbi:SMP-30/gluconolactonase/LRE family protein [Streptomyces sp. NBC_01320]|uniref:SMP-30/gluconolactonase/LRE family protein n=1 Tax=Streptomyces sp. NBC_01320 TaxID=2903824 RepID=UPI002E0EF033|nr:SMP-30/gluconolactonase/LRE family protein [Streptomyces sp. NBC_01320]